MRIDEYVLDDWARLVAELEATRYATVSRVINKTKLFIFLFNISQQHN